MAGFTLFIKLFQVDIFVAVDTAGFQGFVYHGLAFSLTIMALFTGYASVFPGEGILPGVVVIGYFFKPGHHMTAFAVPVKLPLVGVFPVAAPAVGKGHFFCFFPGGMAFGAGQGTVFSLQGIARLVMVKAGNPP